MDFLILMQPRRYWFLAAICLFFSFAGCQKDLENRDYPVVDTKPVTVVNDEGATFEGRLLKPGKSGISDYGFVFGEAEGPAIANSIRVSLGKAENVKDFSILANKNHEKGKQYYMRAYAVSGDKNYIVYGQEVTFTSQGSLPQEITGFSPVKGVVGDTIIMTGSGFSTTLKNNSISIGGIYSDVIYSRHDSLIYTVPYSLSSGSMAVELTIGQNKVSAKDKFSVLPFQVSVFSPKEVSVKDTITINGNNFSPRKDLNGVQMLGTTLSVVWATYKYIKAIISTPPKVSSSILTVNVGLQKITTIDSIYLKTPSIIDFNPRKGTKGTEVIFSVNNLPLKGSDLSITLGNYPLSLIDQSNNKLTLKIPGGITPGFYKFILTYLNYSVSSKSYFEILKTSISSIQPQQGTWGNTIKISGNNFGPGINDNVVKFNNYSAPILKADIQNIMVTVPLELLNKNSNISLTALPMDNQTATYNGIFTLQPPELLSFSPTEAVAGTVVTLIGNNFHPESKYDIIHIGNYVPLVLLASGKSLNCKINESIVEGDYTIDLTVGEQSVQSVNTIHLSSPWKQLDDFPYAYLSDVSFDLKNFGYVLLAGRTLLQYDSQLDSWNRMGTVDYHENAYQSLQPGNIVFLIDSVPYFGFGYYRTALVRYNFSDNSTVRVADLPSEDIMNYASAFSVKSKGYIMGGYDSNNHLNFKVMCYDPSLDLWTRKNDYPGQGGKYLFSFSRDNKGYILSNALWEYDPDTDNWNPVAELDENIGYIAGLAMLNNIIYVVDFSHLWAYSFLNKTWNSFGTYPIAKRSFLRSFTINNKIYLGLGSNDQQWYKDFWQLDPEKIVLQ